METLRCVGRAEITLIGSFADMSLLPSAINNNGADLLVLTSPGHLQLVNHKDLSALTSQHEKRITLSSLECPAVVPTLNPVISTAKLISLVGNENTSKFLLEVTCILRLWFYVRFCVINIKIIFYLDSYKSEGQSKTKI